MATNKYTEYFKTIDERINDKDRIALKRSGGKTLAESNIMSVFYRVAPYDMQRWDEEKVFLATTIYCMNDGFKSNSRPFEACLYDIIKKEQTDGFKHKVENILGMIWEDDGLFAYKLYSLAKRVNSLGYSFDCGKLCDDICNWNNDSKYVQRNWARTIIRGYETPKE